MVSTEPVEFTRSLDNGRQQRAGNRVQLEDADGDGLDLDDLVAPLTLLGDALSPGAIISDQVAVAVTGTAVQFHANQPVAGGCVVVAAPAGNSAEVTLGGATVNNTVDGTGNGYVLEAGKATVVTVANLNTLYVNGTAGDFISYVGAAPPV